MRCILFSPGKTTCPLEDLINMGEDIKKLTLTDLRWIIHACKAYLQKTFGFDQVNSKASDLPIHFYLTIVLWDPQ